MSSWNWRGVSDTSRQFRLGASGRSVDRNTERPSGGEFFLLNLVCSSRMRRCRTQKCGQLDLASTRACRLFICQGSLSKGDAATNASWPRYTPENAYLPHAMHECERFVFVAARDCMSKGLQELAKGAGRRQIESITRCVCRRHLRINSTL